MRFPSNKTLAKICVYGAVSSISAIIYMRFKLEDRVRNTDYFRLAFSTLRKHKGAVSLLGEPIKELSFKSADDERMMNDSDEHTAVFEVNVLGSKDRGKVFFWATRNPETGWLLDRLELEVKSHPDKRFLIKKKTLNESSI